MSKISELSDGGVIQGGDTLIAVRSGGNVKVTYGGSTTANIDGGTIDGTVIGGSTAAAITGTTITGTSFVSSGNMTFGDSDKAVFGAGSDLQIYHDTHSYIQDTGAGNLFLLTQGAEISLLGNTSSEYMGRFIQDGAVELYHNGAQKLATTSTGIDVTGTVTADGLTVESATGAEVTLKSTDSDVAAGEYVGKLHFEGSDSSGGASGVRAGIYAQYGSSFGYTSLDLLTSISGGSLKKAMTISGDGDISFYEDTGTTAKFFWDASAESLGIGTSSPATPLEVDGIIAGASTGVDGTFAPVFNSLYSPNTAYYGQIQHSMSSVSTNSGFRFMGGGTSNATGAGGLQKMLDLTRGQTIFYTADTERLRITSSGACEWRPNGTTQAMTLDASGNLLVGTTSTIPFTFSSGTGAGITSAGTVMAGATAEAGLFNRIGSDGSIVNFYKAGAIVGSIGTAGGDITIGTGDTGLTFEDSADVIHPINQGTGAARDNAIDLGKSAARFKNLYLSGNVLAGSPVLIGISSAAGVGGSPSDTNSAELGQGYINLNRDDTASATQIQFGKNGSVAGSIVTTTSTTYNTTSDQRAKTNIADADDAGAILDAIQVRKFDWKDDGTHQRYGMIAQELLESAPEVVHQPEDPEQMMGVDYSKLVPMLIKEVQSLRARVAQLEGAN
jgi:hypothetical protein